MPFNGSGVYSAPSANFPAVTQTVINSADYNAVINDIASGLSNCITKDGQQTVTADISFNSKKLTNVGDAISSGDAVNVKSIQNGTGVYVATVGGTADAITLSPSPSIAAYAAGQTFRFIASGANTGAVTVNVSGKGAKNVTKNGGTALVSGDIPSGAMVTISYDGTNFEILAVKNEVDVLTTRGDVLRYGSSGYERLGVGSNGQVFSSNGTDTIFQYPPDLSLHHTPSIPINLGLAASVSSNALTIALKGQDGNDPSATNPVWIPFRHSTSSNGTYTWEKVTSAVSVILSAGSTLGAAGDETIRGYVYALRTGANTVVLGLARQALFDEAILQTTTEEGGAGGADSTTVLYTTAAQTSVPVKLIGLFEITSGATAGNWTAVPSVLCPWRTGMRKTGDIVQVVFSSDTTYKTGTTVIPYDNSIPQSTEGTEYMTASITPSSAINILYIEHEGLYGGATNDVIMLALFKDAQTSALHTTGIHQAGTSITDRIRLATSVIAGSTTLQQYKIRGGQNNSTTLGFNGNPTSLLFGGSSVSFIRITEVYA